MELLYQIVGRMLRDTDASFSRNKNFEAYEDPLVKRALRISKHLKSIRSDLLNHEHQQTRVKSVTQSDGTILIELSYHDGALGRRISYLNPMEWQLLTELPSIAKLLNDLNTSGNLHIS